MLNENPIERFNSSLKRAEAAGIPLANGMSLATLDESGRPTCRIMLLKHADEQGFVFYTNLQSPKGRGLKRHADASLCFWWASIELQIRVEGRVQEVSSEEADRYFATRPRGSQIGAWASHQSETLSSRNELLREVEKYECQFENVDVPRPPHWSGYRLNPQTIEFWFGKEDRLHDRILYERGPSGWTEKLLAP